MISKLKKENQNNILLKHSESHKRFQNNKLGMKLDTDKKGKISLTKENINVNQFIDELHKQVNDLNKDLNDIKNDMKLPQSKNGNIIKGMNKNKFKNYENNNYYKNSNDINFWSTEEVEKNNLSANKNRIYTTMSEEMQPNFKESNNYNYNYNYNISKNVKRNLYDKEDFEKMKGSDIDVSHKLESFNNNSNEETNNNLVF